MHYSLDDYMKDLDGLDRGGAKVYSIGKTTLGREIYAVKKGSTKGVNVLVHGGIHAREYVVVPLLMRLMAEYEGEGSIVCIPAVNIDGILLSQYGLDSIEDEDRRKMLLEVNGGSTDFSLWKANANAVDLNVNYNANWGKGKYNVTHRSPANYIGEYPMKEVENRILAGITLRSQPKITLSYHTKGNVVYYGYKDNLAYTDVAKAIANYINYDLLTSNESFGGYKDWFMATTPYLGLTIECGKDSLAHPIDISEVDRLYARHSGILDFASRLSDRIV